MKILALAGTISGITLLMAGTSYSNPVMNPLEGQYLRSVPDTAMAVEKISGFRQSFTAYITGYSYWDNTPPGSAEIARPVIRQKAGGTGSFSDPITIAVGYRLVNGKAHLDFPAGTRFYLPHIQRYAIVEDICGDGPNPHLTGCARGKNGKPWLDIYVDGSRVGPAAANECMYRLTGFHEVLLNPKKGYAVSAGPIAESGCGANSS